MDAAIRAPDPEQNTKDARAPGTDAPGMVVEEAMRQVNTHAIVHGIVLSTLAAGLFVLSRENFQLFHAFAEIFSVAIAGGVFVVAWHTRRFTTNGFLPFVGIVYLGVALIDFLHTMAYPGMNVIAGASTNLGAQFWLAARFLEAGGLIAASLFAARRIRTSAAFTIVMTIAAALVLSILWWDIFPTCFVEGAGADAGLTPFKRVGELVVVAALAVAAVLLQRRRTAFDRRVYLLVLLSLVLTAVAEISFTFYTHAFDAANALGHLLKVLSFYAIYQAVLVASLRSPFKTLFRQLEEKRVSLEHAHGSLERRVEERTSQLKETTVRLQEEMAERIAGEQRFRLMAETIDDFFWMSTPDMDTMLYVGPAFSTIWGREPESLRDDPRLLLEAVHPDDRRTYTELFSEPCSTPCAGEYRIVRPDGDERWVRDRRFPVRDDAGGVRFLVGVASDITNEKLLQLQIEAANRVLEGRVKERSDQLDEAVEEVESIARFPREDPHPIMRLADDGSLMYANPASDVFLRKWGISRNQKVPALWREAAEKARKTTQVQTIEEPVDGRTYIFDIVPISPAGYVNLYGRDVTELRRTSTALEMSEERYRLAQRAAGIGSWEWDLETDTVVRSPEGLRLLGLPESEARQDYQSSMDRIHPEDRPKVQAAVERSLRSGSEYRVEYRVVFPGGRYRWLLDMGSLVGEHTGDGRRMAGVMYDITERKLFEQSLLSEHQIMTRRVQQQNVELTSTRESLKVEETQRQEAQRALSSRERALESVYAIATTFGASAESVLDQVALSLATLLRVPFAEVVLVGPEGFQSRSQFMEGALVVKGSPHCRACARCRTVVDTLGPRQFVRDDAEFFDDAECVREREFNSYLGVPVIDNDGDVLGVLVAMDTSPRRFEDHEVHVAEIFARYVAHELLRERMARQIRQSQQMQMLGQLTSGVAHEVRNPLNAISAVTESLYKRLGDNPTYAPHREHLTRQVKRLAALMEDLLVLGRPVEFRKEPIPIDQLLQGAVHNWSEALPERAGDVRLVLPPDADGWLVRADGLKLQEVFINLLQNAANHSQPGSPIVAQADLLSRSQVRVRVRDEGAGVSPENAARLFEPFFTTRKGGTGLGLSIVRHVVESHGGRVSIYNNGNEPGATAEVVLPLV
ncbi:MAG: PAS domain-containing protein [Chitinivibrionales bacterium]|nr:PAS domain-containing protein [Chitinivibrionales bacterium]